MTEHGVPQERFEAVERAKCREKQTFTSKSSAHKKKRFVRRRKGFSLHPYHCPWCGLWHLSASLPRTTEEATTP